MGSNAKGAWPQLAAGFWWAIGTAVAYGLLVALTTALLLEEPAADGGDSAAQQGGATCSLSSPWA